MVPVSSRPPAIAPTPPLPLAPPPPPPPKPAIVSGALPSGRLSAPPSAPSASLGVRAAGTSATITAMHSEEAARARTFGRVTAILCLGALLAQIPYERNHAIRQAHFTVVSHTWRSAARGFGWLIAHATPPTYTRTVFRIFRGRRRDRRHHDGAVFRRVFCGVRVLRAGIRFFWPRRSSTLRHRARRVAIAILHGASAFFITIGIVPDVGIFFRRATHPRSHVSRPASSSSSCTAC